MCKRSYDDDECLNYTFPRNVVCMDDDSLRNWGYYEPPPLKGNLGLQLMSSMTDRDTKPFLTTRDNPVMLSPNAPFITQPPVYVRDSWINHREKFLHMFPGNPYNPVLAEPSRTTHLSIQMLQVNSSMEDPSVKKEAGSLKKRDSDATSKAPKVKKPRKAPAPKENSKNLSVHRAKTAKKNVDVVINGVDMDISRIPIPVCSCTGSPQQCYRWGCGGWQSACCTTTISMYPLPMSTKRRGARIAGRKMSQGAFKKVLEKLAAEAYSFADPIDLRTYWAKHGTNKFVTIR